jgi:hypothetical protein
MKTLYAFFSWTNIRVRPCIPVRMIRLGGLCLLLFTLHSSLFTLCNAQNVAINTNGAPPNPSAMLDVNSTRGGFLPPRMTTAQINAIANPATGLMVLNTVTNCVEYYNGVSWQNIACPCTTPAPDTPSVPSGNTSPQTGAAYTYTIPPVAGAVLYAWSVSTTNGAVTSGQGTTAATITFSGTSATMNICVYAGNACGNSSPSCLSVTSFVCNHGSVSFPYSDSLQTWIVPSCITLITITASGASGGAGGVNTSGSAGLGATLVSPSISVTPGHTLAIMVGGMGIAGTSFGGGGGGGTYIWDSTSSVLLLTAGGGGGSGYGPYGGGDGQTDTGILTAPTNSTGGGINAAGGTGGAGSSGGSGGTSGTWNGGGGAGWGENGFNGGAASGGSGGGGADPANGGAGGIGTGGDLEPGGYGGGGGAAACGGGGGGYNGGGGGQDNGSYGGGGGGGGSYCITGTPTTSTNSGNGSVTIQY